MPDHDHQDLPAGTTLEDIEKALRELERLGLAYRTGEFRNGRPVYVAAEFLERSGTA